MENDSYVREYQILTRVGSVITVSDTSDALPTGPDTKWIIRGFRKADALFLTSYALHYKMLTNSQTFFKGNIGANAE